MSKFGVWTNKAHGTSFVKEFKHKCHIRVQGENVQYPPCLPAKKIKIWLQFCLISRIALTLHLNILTPRFAFIHLTPRSALEVHEPYIIHGNAESAFLPA